MPACEFEQVCKKLRANPRRWLVTGAAGFIGSNLTEKLLQLGQHVVGLDNFATGYRHNLSAVERAVGPQLEKNFNFIEGSITDLATCKRACAGVELVLHQGALGSVPRSIEEPLASHNANVDGFINMLEAARAANVRRFVYASSSSVYGDEPELPKREEKIGNPLSPYAATKLINEVYATTWAKAYGCEIIGLRYFNVFGPRQDPNGAYAAVIPKWLDCVIAGKACVINGDGETSRDFCYIDNAVQANILAAVAPQDACGEVYNIACGSRINLNQLHDKIWSEAVKVGLTKNAIPPERQDFRKGDVRHSLADISKAQARLGFSPDVSVERGLELLVRVVAKASPR